jgi:hypothetical protein
MNAGVELAILEASLNTAIAAESFAEAMELLNRYAAVLERHARAAAGTAGVAPLQADSIGFLERIETAIKAVRAGAQTELARLQRLANYAPQPRTARSF